MRRSLTLPAALLTLALLAPAPASADGPSYRSNMPDYHTQREVGVVKVGEYFNIAGIDDPTYRYGGRNRTDANENGVAEKAALYQCRQGRRAFTSKTPKGGYVTWVVECEAGEDAEFVPIVRYWSRGRQDNYVGDVDFADHARRHGYNQGSFVTGLVRRQPNAEFNRPLEVWYQPSSKNHRTIADSGSIHTARKVSARKVTTLGYVASSPGPALAPLKLYYHQGRKDFLTVGTKEGEAIAERSGYEYQNTQGYVRTLSKNTWVDKPEPLDFVSQTKVGYVEVSRTGLRKKATATYRRGGGTSSSYWGNPIQAALHACQQRLPAYAAEARPRGNHTTWLADCERGPSSPWAPMVRYWSSARKDNYLGKVDFRDQASRHGYDTGHFVEGLVRRGPARHWDRRLQVWYSPQRKEHMTVATSRSVAAAKGAGYRAVTVIGFIADRQLPGLVPLKLYYHPGRKDHISVATAQGESTAKSSGYRYVRTEGWVKPLELIDD